MRLRGTVYAIRAVRGRDVAEPAFLRARYLPGRQFGRQPADQCAKVLYELFVHGVRRYADRVVSVGDLALELEVPVPFKCLWDRVQVNHQLDDAGRVFRSGLRVDDDRFVAVVSLRDQVGLARQRC